MTSAPPAGSAGQPKIGEASANLFLYPTMGVFGFDSLDSTKNQSWQYATRTAMIDFA